MDLRGSLAVVTGGGSGLGAALVRRLAEAGAHPVLLDVRADRIERQVAELDRCGKRADGWVCDVGRREQVRRVFSEIGAHFDRIDLLINCAGRSTLLPFSQMSDEEIDWTLGPNLMGVVHCLRAALPWMPYGSRIVNITSLSGRIPTPGEAFYSAAKAAVVSLSESLLAELSSRGVGVTVVLPGEMSTTLFDAHASWEIRPDFQRRMELPPDRVARAILRAVRRERFEVVVPAYMRAVLLLQRISPALFRRGVARYYRRLLEPGFDERASAPTGTGSTESGASRMRIQEGGRP